MSAPTAIERATQARRLLAAEGWGGVCARLLRRTAQRIAPAGAGRLPVSREDLLRAGEIAAEGLRLPPPLPHSPGQPLQVAWICAPPGAGAGGFTTISRLIAGLEAAGHRCVLYLHDRHGWSLARHRQTIRQWWPTVQADVRDASQGIADAHAIFATSWETAYPALSSPARGRRMYLVQDHEPSFHPAGSESLLAQATYRFGFHGVTAGRWLAQTLRSEYGMRADWFDFGCELDLYSVDPLARRTGVCLYSRPSTPRRAFELAVAALEIFSGRHPDVDVHLFGEPAHRLPFAAEDHGLLSPQQLNDLYNRCAAGLVLSATNVSLVPYEMLASGCIPVVNDALHNRRVLDNEHVRYAPATPWALASALGELVRREPAAGRAAADAAAASVRHASWAQAASRVERIVGAAVHPEPPSSAGRGAAQARHPTGSPASQDERPASEATLR